MNAVHTGECYASCYALWRSFIDTPDAPSTFARSPRRMARRCRARPCARGARDGWRQRRSRRNRRRTRVIPASSRRFSIRSAKTRSATSRPCALFFGTRPEDESGEETGAGAGVRPRLIFRRDFRRDGDCAVEWLCLARGSEGARELEECGGAARVDCCEARQRDSARAG